MTIDQLSQLITENPILPARTATITMCTDCHAPMHRNDVDESGVCFPCEYCGADHSIARNADHYPVCRECGQIN